MSHSEDENEHLKEQSYLDAERMMEYRSIMEGAEMNYQDGDATGYSGATFEDVLIHRNVGGGFTLAPGQRFIGDTGEDVGATPTPEKDEALFFGPGVLKEMREYLGAITSFVANIRRKDTDASAYDDAIDACFELDAILNPPK